MGRSLLVDGTEVGENALVKEAIRKALRAAQWVSQHPSRVPEILQYIMEEDPELFICAVEEICGPHLDEYGLTRDQRRQVEELMREGRKIPAVKAVREFIDLGLKEAKDLVEDIERKLTPLT